MGSDMEINPDGIERFRDWLYDQELAANTIRSYCTSMEQFFRKYGTISKENCLKWRTQLLDEGNKASTINLKLCALNAYCKMTGSNVRIKRLKIQRDNCVNNVISADDYHRLLDCLLRDGNERWYYNIKLLASTGARVSEYIRLQKSDFDRGYAELWTKGKIRRVYIPAKFRADSANHYAELEQSDYLVQSRYGGQITSRGVSQMLQNLAKRYGIDSRVMHPHSFRHLFALEFLERNGNLSLLSDVLGHSSVATTSIYTRMSMEQQISAVNKTVCW